MDKKVLLVGINAKYIHSNLAIRYLQKYAAQFKHEYSVLEFTINQQQDFILSEIYRQKPDILGFSCYIWNIELIKRLTGDIKKILPDIVIVLGGPEIADTAYGADYIINGVGEEAFFRLVSAIADGAEIPSNTDDKFDFSKTVFPYGDEDFDALNGRIIYYEAQRGCPYKCAYCLSSDSEGVSILPIRRVYEELSEFIKRGVKQVKFVDRTFNCDKTFRKAIWKYLIENDNGITNFHFEIKAELLDDEDFVILSKARKSLFQFEIGVQSTNGKTLMEINRKTDLSALTKNVGRLSELNTIHLHLDLIAGLPHEGFSSFKKSFNDVFSLNPDVLQLGFLKALKGCNIHRNADKYGIKYSEHAPYEVLCTNELSYYELLELKGTEHMLESYYNSGLAVQSVKYFIQFFESPFDFFHKLGQFWVNRMYNHVQHSKLRMYEILLEFFELYTGSEHEEQKAIAKEAVIYDILINDNIKTLPESVQKPISKDKELFISELFTDTDRIAQIEEGLLKFNYKQLRKKCNVYFFNYAVYDNFEKRDCAVFFHYLTGRGTATALEWRR